jgi:hypothetical protein
MRDGMEFDTSRKRAKEAEYQEVTSVFAARARFETEMPETGIFAKG